MKKYALFCLLPIVQLLTACSEKSDPTPQNTDGCPVATFRYPEDDRYATDHFEYKNGKISKIRKTGGYSAQKTTNISYDGAGDIQVIDDGFERLDATISKDGQGRPIVITVVTSSSSYRYTTHYLFQYNAEGYITEEVEFFDHPTAFQALYDGDMNDFRAAISNLLVESIPDSEKMETLGEGIDEMSKTRYVYDLPGRAVTTYLTPKASRTEKLLHTKVYDGRKNPLDTPNWRQYELIKKNIIFPGLGNLAEWGPYGGPNVGRYNYEYSDGGSPLLAYYTYNNVPASDRPYYEWTYACQ